MRHYQSVASLLALAAALSAACGKKAEPPPQAPVDAAAPPPVAPIATPVVGVDSVRRMNFQWDAGQAPFEKVVTALRAKQRDWAVIRAHAEATIAKDPNHLEARRLLGTALAKLGEPAAAVEHLVAALAADYYRYAPALAKDEDLKELFATVHGASVRDASEKIKAEYQRRIATGVLLVARRSAFRWPKPGTEYATSRGELYAFDRELRRYLRLSHTENQVAGFVRSPSGAEVLVLGFDRIVARDGKSDGKAGTQDAAARPPEAPPTIAAAWLEVLDTSTWSRVGKRVGLGPGREVAVGYGPGDQILVALAPAAGRWSVGAPALWSIDRTTSAMTKVSVPLPVPRIVYSLEDGRVVRTALGVTAAWTGDPPVAPSVAAGGAPIAIPESGATAQSTVAISPGGAYIAFATAVDPCAKDVAPSLYVADSKTGALRHLLTSRSRFATRWLDATTLAYEDGDAAIRLWDAKRDGRGGEVLRLENKPGVALDVLSLAPGPLCKQQPPAAETGAGSGDEPPLPPEEPAPPAPPGPP
jgi:hypothetical protein